MAAIWGMVGAAFLLMSRIMPKFARFSLAGVEVQRGTSTHFITWSRFHNDLSGPRWISGYLGLRYRRSSMFDLGAMWISRSMAEALHGRGETAGWKEQTFLGRSASKKQGDVGPRPPQG
ncbi:MAG TPA: hypothetical protein VFG07_04280 [Thermoplasmata archaeon]|nr:hypothetical protein [Thermoplasmata archaeon]